MKKDNKSEKPRYLLVEDNNAQSTTTYKIL